MVSHCSRVRAEVLRPARGERSLHRIATRSPHRSQRWKRSVMKKGRLRRGSRCPTIRHSARRGNVGRTLGERSGMSGRYGGAGARLCRDLHCSPIFARETAGMRRPSPACREGRRSCPNFAKPTALGRAAVCIPPLAAVSDPAGAGREWVGARSTRRRSASAKIGWSSPIRTRMRGSLTSRRIPVAEPGAAAPVVVRGPERGPGPAASGRIPLVSAGRSPGSADRRIRRGSRPRLRLRRRRGCGGR